MKGKKKKKKKKKKRKKKKNPRSSAFQDTIHCVPPCVRDMHLKFFHYLVCENDYYRRLYIKDLKMVHKHKFCISVLITI